MKKKIGYIFLLIVIIVGIVFFLKFQEFIKPSGNNGKQIAGMRSTNEISKNEITNSKTDNSNKNTIKTDLEDGTLYSYTGTQDKAEVVIGDNYFDTQINEIMLNYNNYKGKTVEIEGMYIGVYNPYTIVGRYSTNNLCAYCPVGYSGFEYIWKGDKIEVENEKTWLKIVGTFESANDASSNFQDYYYINATSIEVMNESGIKTVAN